MKKKLVAFLVLFAMVIACIQPVQNGFASAEEDEKPILTIACLSDMHNQGTILTNNNPPIRGTIDLSVDGMLEQEDQVDVIINGGDTSSNDATSEEKLYKVLDRVEERLNELTENTLWICGNHDFNAGEANYNSEDYFNKFVKPHVGDVETEDDVYTEEYNGVEYVCGYHYTIKGFDFICLSASYEILRGDLQQSNYYFSDGTFNWLAETLDRVGDDKPVFVSGHFPLRDSNNISGAGKGFTAAADKKAKEIFLKHPNVIYLYGHDHAGDKAYISSNTEERVTVYDENGNVMNKPGSTGAGFGERSFMTSFMGSLRYYNNSIDTVYPGPNNSKVVQALLVYVYYDKIVFQMKNYGERAAKDWDLTPYVYETKVMDRPVEATEAPTQAPATAEPQAQATAAPQNTVPQQTAPAITTTTGDKTDKITVAAPSGLKLKRKGKKVTISFKKVPNANGYEIYYSTKKKSGYKQLDTVFKTSFKTGKFKKGKKYFVKVKAYNNSTGKIYYSKYSAVKYVK